MRFLMLLGLISMPVLAAEVATLQANKLTKELVIYMTDETLFQNAEKQYMTHPCRLKSSINMSINMRESLVPTACRAEITKFFLNAGYKPLDAKTFIK